MGWTKSCYFQKALLICTCILIYWLWLLWSTVSKATLRCNKTNKTDSSKYNKVLLIVNKVQPEYGVRWFFCCFVLFSFWKKQNKQFKPKQKSNCKPFDLQSVRWSSYREKHYRKQVARAACELNAVGEWVVSLQSDWIYLLLQQETSRLIWWAHSDRMNFNRTRPRLSERLWPTSDSRQDDHTSGRWCRA